MADGSISIDVELNEEEFRESLENMGGIVESGALGIKRSVDMMGRNFRILPSNINTALSIVPGVVDRLISSISDKDPLMAAAGSSLFGSLGENITQVTANLVSRLPEVAYGIREKIMSFLPEMAETGEGFFNSLKERLPESVLAIAGQVPQIPAAITERLREEQWRIVNAGVRLFRALTENLQLAIITIAQAPGKIVDKLVTVFTSLLFHFHNIGVSIVQGVWEGISSMAAWLSQRVSGFFSGIIGGITGFLGINSPSALFRDMIGRNIALGIGAGIAEEMPGVARDMRAYIDGLVASADRIGGLTGSLSIKQSGPGRAAGGEIKAETGDAPSVNITLEPAGDMRGFFEYLSMEIKRVDYLGGAGI